jgi:hypothetical protein
MAVPSPHKASDRTANVCSRQTKYMNTAVNAKKPGISRIDWRMPISLPVKAAPSMAKLFNSADQVENAMAFAATIRMSRLTGVLQPVASPILISVCRVMMVRILNQHHLFLYCYLRIRGMTTDMACLSSSRSTQCDQVGQAVCSAIPLQVYCCPGRKGKGGSIRPGVQQKTGSSATQGPIYLPPGSCWNDWSII